MPNKLTRAMVNELNADLTDTCLKYLEDFVDGGIATYKLKVLDKYVDARFQMVPNTCPEFEERVRGFFKHRYGVTETGYMYNITILRVHD